MSAGDSATARPAHPGGIGRDIAAAAARAGLHLRFDRVALRVIGLLQSGAAEIVPEGQVVLLTLTAPIRQPARTAAAVEILLRHGGPTETRTAIYGNSVSLRRVLGIGPRSPRLLAFVHNWDSDAATLLDLAEALIRVRL